MESTEKEKITGKPKYSDIAIQSTPLKKVHSMHPPRSLLMIC